MPEANEPTIQLESSLHPVPLSEYEKIASAFEDKRNKAASEQFDDEEFHNTVGLQVRNLYEREKQVLVQCLQVYSLAHLLLTEAPVYGLISGLDIDLVGEAATTIVSLKLLMASEDYAVPQSATASYIVSLKFHIESLLASLGSSEKITPELIIEKILGEDVSTRLPIKRATVRGETPLQAAERLSIPKGMTDQVKGVIRELQTGPASFSISDDHTFTRSLVFPGQINILPDESVPAVVLHNAVGERLFYFEEEGDDVIVYLWCPVTGRERHLILTFYMSVLTFERLTAFLDICAVEDQLGFERSILLDVKPEIVKYYEAIYGLAEMFREERAQNGLLAPIPTGTGDEAVAACDFGDIHANRAYIRRGLEKLVELSKELFGEPLSWDDILDLIRREKLIILLKGDLAHREPEKSYLGPVWQNWLRIYRAIAEYEDEHNVTLGSGSLWSEDSFEWILERDIEAEDRIIEALERDSELRDAIWEEVTSYLQVLRQIYELKKLNREGVIVVRGNHDDTLEEFGPYEKVVSAMIKFSEKGLIELPFSSRAQKAFGIREIPTAYRETHILRAALRYFLGEEVFSKIIEMENNMRLVAQGGAYLVAHTLSEFYAAQLTREKLEASTSGEVDSARIAATIRGEDEGELAADVARKALKLGHNVKVLLGHYYSSAISYLLNVLKVRWPDEIGFIPDTRTPEYRVLRL